MSMQRRTARRPIAGLALLFAAWAFPASMNRPAMAGGGAGGDGDSTCEVGVPVRARVRLTNNNGQGQSANDLHFYMYQNDRPAVVVTGASASNGIFSDVGVSLDSSNNDDVPPGQGPPYHGAQVDMSGGSVADGGTVTVDVLLCMNEKNVLKITDITWTRDGAPIGQNSPPPRGGWRVGRPFIGGDGGNLTDPGGGGRGAQEGDGGGEGPNVHLVCIENDDPNFCLRVNVLKLLASMTFYEAPDAILTLGVDPIKNPLGEPPVVVPPGGKWCYPFQTQGAYLGGHVYLYYEAQVVDCATGLPGGAGPPNSADTDGFGRWGVVASGSQPLLMFGDHPNPDPSPDADGDGLWDAWEEIYDLSTEDNGGNNGPSGDPDGDGLSNQREQALLTDPTDPTDPMVIRDGKLLMQTLSSIWTISPSNPLPADFFGPGSDPFTGAIQLAGQPLNPDVCGGSLSDTVVRRKEPSGLPHVGSQDVIPIELVSLNLVSVSPISVTYNGGPDFTLFDVKIEAFQSQAPGSMTIRREHYLGGTFDSTLPVTTVLTFTEVSNPMNVFQTLRTDWIQSQNVPWRREAHNLTCLPCMENFIPGYSGVRRSWDFLGDEFHQSVSVACSEGFPVAGNIPPGADLFKTITPTSWQFGDGFPPIPADFFAPGSEPFVGTVQFMGEPLLSSPFCPGPIGQTDTIVQRLRSANVPSNGSTDTIPIELVELSLQSVAPIQIFPMESFFDVFVELSTELPSTGEMRIDRTSGAGGTFTSEFYVHPKFTFVNTANPMDVRVLDGPEYGVGSRLRDASSNGTPWNFNSGALELQTCAPNFLPTVDHRLRSVPLALGQGPGMHTLRVTDLSGSSTIWTDFAYTGLELGTFELPFNTIAESITGVPVNGTIKIKGASTQPNTSAKPRITKKMVIRAIGGPVKIGVP